MNAERFKMYFLFAISLSLAIGLFIHLNSILQLLAPDDVLIPARRGAEHLMRNMSITFFVALCTFFLNYYLVKPLDPLKKVSLKMVLAALLITVVSVFILSDLFHGIAHFLSNRDMDIHFNAVFAARDLITALFILSGIFVIKTVYDRQAYILENERLTRENLLGQFESLKNQLSPHFLFNSLSALKSLILENPENAQRYIDHLSRVLRYSLKSKGENTVTLAEELEELNSYLYLVKMRYEDSIRIDTDIPEKYLRHRIPRLALQTLVENAVKHNVISKRHPLLIHTFVKDHRVHVSNTRREKQKAEAGNGIGLANLMSQYRMLNSRDILIERTSDEFKVALPLLKRDTDESSHS